MNLYNSQNKYGFDQINDKWEEIKVQRLVKDHCIEDREAGINACFAHAVEESVRNYPAGQLSIHQLAMVEDIIYSKAPLGVITEYSELDNTLFIMLARINTRTGWITSAHEPLRPDPSICFLATVFPDGEAIIENGFNYQHLNVVKSHLKDYRDLDFSYDLAYEIYLKQIS
jgi:hypothetical protein